MRMPCLVENENALLQTQLIQASTTHPASLWLAQIIANWQYSCGVMPAYLGLIPTHFHELMVYFFPSFNQSLINCAQDNSSSFNGRMSEKEDLIKYLNFFVLPHRLENDWIITILVNACLGNDHLWQDLGLFSRTDLSDFLAYFFPNMAKQNVHNMKWKKFIYKQLCDTQGIYVCRAPSCEFCMDYLNCFGEED